MADNHNHAPTWVTKAGFGVLTLNSGLAIYRACWEDDQLVSILFVSGSYLTLLLLLFGALRERVAARHTVLTLSVGVVNCDMSISMHKASSGDPASATCVLLSYAALLALVWLLVRQFTDHARGEVVVGYEQG